MSLKSGTPYSVQIEEDPQAKLVDEMASHLGLRRVSKDNVHVDIVH